MNNTIFLFVVIIVACTASVSSDIYTPSMPVIAQALNTSIDSVQASMAIFMFGLAISQLIYGPASDIWGRKKPLLLGLFIFCLGNIITCLAQDMFTLNLGRLIQGLGAGASASIWRSMFRDKYSGAEMAKYGGYLAIAMTLIVPAAPLVGAFLQNLFNWRASFIFMIFYGVIAGILIQFAIIETHDLKSIQKFSLMKILNNYFSLMTHKIFLGYTLISFLAFGAFFSWFVIGPVLIIKNMGYSESFFGWITFMGGGTAIACSGAVNAKLVKTWGSLKILKLGWNIIFISGLLLMSGSYLFGLNLYAIFGPIILFYFGVCLIFPNSFAQAFTPFGHMAGTAAALYSCLQTTGAVVSGIIASVMPDYNQVPLAIIILITPFFSWLTYTGLKLNG